VARRDGLTVGPEAQQALVRTTSRFAPSRPQPGPALALHRKVRDYQAQRRAAGDVVTIDRKFVEEVFSLYSGLPRFVVSHAETIPGREIRAWFEDRLVGQREAIEAVVEAIALFKAGLNDPNRPIGSFLFVGPTGVGKTELARLLATFLFGSASRMLRFDLSEFKDYHSFEMLVGDPGKPERPARLVDPVRAQPFQVVLFDELEKAHANVWDLFLQLLDEGQLTAASGQQVSFRNTMIIATSNVGAGESPKGLGFGARPGEDERAKTIRAALERQFRPEFLNRFQHVVVFHALSADQVRTIARQEVNHILVREGITSRNLVVDVSDAALDLVIGRAFDPRYGARALKRELQRQLVLPIAMSLMERRVDPGSVLTVGVKDGEVRVRVVETSDSRAARKATEPIRDPEGKILTREEMMAGLEGVRPAIEEIAAAVDEPFLRAERHRLLEMRRDPEFWNHPDEAAMAIRDLDRYTAWLGRLDRLRERADDIGTALGEASLRRELTDLAHRYRQLETAIATTRREMVTMGSDGVWDALIEVRPLGARGCTMRDLLVRAYLGWAEHRRYEVIVLREPVADDEAMMIAVQGHHAHGFLAAERGLHKLRTEHGDSVACVRTAPWTDRRDAARFTVHRALKATGQLGGALRSRLECDGGLVLQNGNTLTENRELAGNLILSWSRAPTPPDDIVRRYDQAPFMLRDVATGVSSGRGDALAPRSLHALLCQRVDQLGEPGG
ncbi:MAG TPA: AAA family ATPase, partial [Kofleriaceae bacterium]|nr:AAA family ATPase [Kofleriaceae bacterium]